MTGGWKKGVSHVLLGPSRVCSVMCMWGIGGCFSVGISPALLGELQRYRMTGGWRCSCQADMNPVVQGVVEGH